MFKHPLIPLFFFLFFPLWLGCQVNCHVENKIPYKSNFILNKWLYTELGKLYPNEKEVPLIPAINLYFKHYHSEIQEKYCNASYNEEYEPFISPWENHYFYRAKNLDLFNIKFNTSSYSEVIKKDTLRSHEKLYTGFKINKNDKLLFSLDSFSFDSPYKMFFVSESATEIYFDEKNADVILYLSSTKSGGSGEIFKFIISTIEIPTSKCQIIVLPNYLTTGVNTKYLSNFKKCFF